MKYTTNSLENHWMPFTANRDFKADPRLIVRAEGCYYYDYKGGKLIDGSSGLFCCPLGHGRDDIADAVSVQLRECDYTPHFQMGHPSSFELATMLSTILPDTMDHVFFVNSGSETVDTALKIAMVYHRARGEGQRIRFVSRERAYHGVNIGGTSLSGLVTNRESFSVVMPGVVHMRHTWLEENRYSMGQPEHGRELADDLHRAVQTLGTSAIAACVVEPIAGSTGCLVPPKGYLERLREICDEHGILLIFDEVITGFGRTGAAFAAHAFGVTPDIMTMAKAITNGAQPMGAIAVTDTVYNTIVDAAPGGRIEFFHGYTYSAHPASCAAGLVTQRAYREEKSFANAAALSPYFLEQVATLADLDSVVDVRGYGLLAGIDVKPGNAPGVRGQALQKQLFWKGMHIKFTGDCGILAPAFICTKDNVDEMIAILKETLSS